MTETTTAETEAPRRKRCRRCGTKLSRPANRNEAVVFCNATCLRREKRARWRRNRKRKWTAAARETCPTPALKVWFNPYAAQKFVDDRMPGQSVYLCPGRGGDRDHFHTRPGPGDRFDRPGTGE